MGDPAKKGIGGGASKRYGAAADMAKTIYFGKQNGSGLLWRVLSTNETTTAGAGTGVLLLSDNLLAYSKFNTIYTNLWYKSTVRGLLQEIYTKAHTSSPEPSSGVTFDGREKAQIAETQLTDVETGGKPDYLFLLSNKEVAGKTDKSKRYGFTDDLSRRAIAARAYRTSSWWLRSPGSYRTRAFAVDFDGGVGEDRVYSYSFAVRPAFNLNPESVLFLSAAVGGKRAEACVGKFGVDNTYDGKDGWKVTLRDDNIKTPTVGAVEVVSAKWDVNDLAAVAIKEGKIINISDQTLTGKLKISYSDATPDGKNMYVSALLKDGDTFVNYAKVNAITSKKEISGTKFVDITNVMPESGSKDYTLYIYGEQENGDKNTDYASSFSVHTVTIPAKPAVVKVLNHAKYGASGLTVNLSNNCELGFEGGKYDTKIIVGEGEKGKITADKNGTTLTGDVTLGNKAVLTMGGKFTLENNLFKLQSDLAQDKAGKIEAEDLTISGNLKIQFMNDPIFATGIESVMGKRIPILTVTNGIDASKMNKIIGLSIRGTRGIFTPTLVLGGDKTIYLTGFTFGFDRRYQLVRESAWQSGSPIPYGSVVEKDTDGKLYTYKVKTGVGPWGRVGRELDKGEGVTPETKRFVWHTADPSAEKEADKRDHLKEVTDTAADADIVVTYNAAKKTDQHKESFVDALDENKPFTAFVGAKSNTGGRGGAVYLNKVKYEEVKADFVRNCAVINDQDVMYGGGAIFNNEGQINAIIGDFIGNYADAIDAIFENTITNGGAIDNGPNSSIGAITGDFIGNYATSGYLASGGAIYNHNAMDILEGDFIGNYTSVTSNASGSAYGGAIYNSGRLGSITGNFIGNYAKNTGNSGEATGGAINNVRILESITGNFIGNYAKNSGNGGSALGGAIYNNEGTTSIVAGAQDILFSGNYVSATNGKALGGAIYNSGTGDNGIYLRAAEGKSITFEGRDGDPIVDSVHNEGNLSINEADGEKTYTGTVNFARITDAATPKGTMTINGGIVNIAGDVTQNKITIADGAMLNLPGTGKIVRTAIENSGVLKGNLNQSNNLIVKDSGVWHPVFTEHASSNTVNATLSNGGTIDIAYDTLTKDAKGKFTPTYNKKTQMDAATVSSLTINGGVLKIQSALAKLDAAASEVSKADSLRVTDLTLNGKLKIQVMYDPSFATATTATGDIIGKQIAVLTATNVTGDLSSAVAVLATTYDGKRFCPTLAFDEQNQNIYLTGFTFKELSHKYMLEKGASWPTGVTAPYGSVVKNDTDGKSYLYKVRTYKDAAGYTAWGHWTTDKGGENKGEKYYVWHTGNGTDADPNRLSEKLEDGTDVTDKNADIVVYYDKSSLADRRKEAYNNETAFVGIATTTQSLGGALKNTAIIDSMNADFIGNYVIGNYVSLISDQVLGGAIYNEYDSKIDTLTGDFIGNYASGSSYAYGGAIYISPFSGIMSTLTGDFIGNYASSELEVVGGAIFNGDYVEIGSIKGDFIGNYVYNNKLAPEEVIYKALGQGGAINNNGTITNLTGDFIGNYAYSNIIVASCLEEMSGGEGVMCRGGAINNGGTIINLTGDFIGNYASSSGSSSAQGGAIYNTGTVTFLAEDKDILFSGNYVSSGDSTKALGGAIYNGNEMYLRAAEGKSITFEGRDGDPIVDSVHNEGNFSINAPDGEKTYTGTVNFATVTGANGKIYINGGTVNLHGAVTQQEIENNAFLNFEKGSTLASNITMKEGSKGVTNFNTDFTVGENQKITQDTINIGDAGKSATVTTNIDNLNASSIKVGSAGVLNLTSGMIGKAIANSGTVAAKSGAVVNSTITNTPATGKVKLEKDSSFGASGKVTGGELVFEEGTEFKPANIENIKNLTSNGAKLNFAAKIVDEDGGKAIFENGRMLNVVGKATGQLNLHDINLTGVDPAAWLPYEENKKQMQYLSASVISATGTDMTIANSLTAVLGNTGTSFTFKQAVDGTGKKIIGWMDVIAGNSYTLSEVIAGDTWEKDGKDYDGKTHKAGELINATDSAYARGVNVYTLQDSGNNTYIASRGLGQLKCAEDTASASRTMIIKSGANGKGTVKQMKFYGTGATPTRSDDRGGLIIGDTSKPTQTQEVEVQNVAEIAKWKDHKAFTVNSNGELSFSGEDVNLTLLDGIVNNDGGTVTFNQNTILKFADDDVSKAGKLSGAGSYINKRTMTIADMAKLDVSELTNKGIVNLEDNGTLGVKIAGGTFNIKENVTSQADKIAGDTNTIAASKTLTITSGTLARAVSGDGTVKFTGGDIAADVTSKVLEIAGHVTAKADNIKGTTNKITSGTLKLTSGIVLNGQVTGNGTLEFATDIRTNVANVAADTNMVDSGVTLTLTGTDTATGTLNKVISGEGNLVVDGTVSSGVANFANSGALSVRSGTLELTSGTLTKAIDNAGTVKLAGANLGGAYVTKGTLEFAQSISTNASYVAAATNRVDSGVTLTLTGTDTATGTLSKVINGDGNLVVDGTVSSDVANLANSGALSVRSGTLELTSGTLTRAIDNAGTVKLAGANLDGAYVTNGTLEFAKDLAINANYVVATTNIVDNGVTLTLNDGTLSKAVANSGTVKLAGANLGGAYITKGTLEFAKDLAINANYVAATTNIVDNGVTLTLNDGTLSKAITNSGVVKLAGANLGGAYVTKGTLEFAKDLAINANYVVATTNIVDNGVTLTLNDGTLSKAMTNSGVVKLNGATLGEAHVTSGTLEFAKDLAINANYVVATTNIVDNGVTLTLNDGTLSKAMTNSGVVKLAGAALGEAHVTSGTLEFAKDLTINANYVAATTNIVDNGVTLTLNDGTLSKAMTNSGVVKLAGAALGEAHVTSGTLEFAKDLTINANYVAATTNIVDNGVTLTLNDGTLSKAITNNGIVKLAGANLGGAYVTNGMLEFVSNLVTNASYVAAVTNLVDSGVTLTLNEGTLTKAVMGDGTVKFTGGELAADVTSSQLEFAGDITANADKIQGIISNKVTSGTLELISGTLTTALANSSKVTMQNGVKLNSTVTNETATASTKLASGASFGVNGKVTGGELVFEEGTEFKPANIENIKNLTSNGAKLNFAAKIVDEDGGKAIFENGRMLNVVGKATGQLNLHDINLTGVDPAAWLPYEENKKQMQYLSASVISATGTDMTIANSLTAVLGNTGTSFTFKQAVDGTGKKIIGWMDVIAGNSYTLSEVIAGDTWEKDGKDYDGKTHKAGELINATDSAYARGVNVYTLQDSGNNTYIASRGLGQLKCAEDTASASRSMIIKSGTNDDGTIKQMKFYGTGAAVTSNEDRGGLIIGDTSKPQQTQNVEVQNIAEIAKWKDHKAFTVNSNGELSFNGEDVKLTLLDGIVNNDGGTVTFNQNTILKFADEDTKKAGTLSGKGSYINNALMTVTDVAKLAMTGQKGLENIGTVILTGGTLAKGVTVTGTGLTLIDGVVKSDTKIANMITINPDKSLEISADNVGGEVTNNEGTLILNGGTLSQQVNTALEGQIGTIDLQAATEIAAKVKNQNIKATKGYSKVSVESYIANNDLTFNGGGFDFRDDKVSNYVVKNINLTDNGNLKLDVDLANKLMDTLNVADGGGVTGTGKLHVTALTLLSDAKQNKTNIAFSETDALKGHVVSDVTHVASDMWKYLVAYDKETGEFAFTKSGRSEPDKPEVSETVMSISDTAQALNVSWLNNINNLQKRLGDLRGGEASNTGWARFQRSNDDVNTGRKANVSGNLYQLGYDIALKSDAASRGYFGLSLERFDGSQSYKIGGGDVKSTSLSAYYTKIYDSGHYFDFIFRYGRYESDTTSYDAGLSTKLDYGMNGVTLSGEYGYRANIGKNGFYFEPQAEVIYGYLAGAKKTSSRGILADIDSTNHFVTRLGVALGKKVKNFNYYLRGSYYHDFAGSTNILYGDASYKQDSARNWWELSLGGGWNMTDASYFYAELTKHFKDVSNSINFNLGFRFTL
ncbi:MAG: DUF6273 domain-containing protein [Synergistaceae bacterium]|nr:DUF6273 domain-containing protein [Synergistaceae bacterium]